MMNLDALFNNLLTSGIGLSNSETLRKLRILNTFHLVVIMTAPLLGLFYFYVGALVLFYGTILTGLLMISSFLLLRKTRSLVLGGHFAISILWAFLFLVSWNTGAITFEGVIHPTWILNGSLILLAVLLMSYLHGSLWTMIMFLQVGAIVYLYQIRFQFPNLLPVEMTAIYHLGTFMIGFLILVLVAFLFEREKEEALLREESNAQALRESKKYIDDILERSPVPTFIIDRNHRVVQWNPACQELTGIMPGEVLGKRVWDGFRMGQQGSLADIILDEPGAIEEHFREATLSKSESGWYEMDLFLPHLKKGRRVLIKAGAIADETGAVRGAIQTVQESPCMSLGEALTDSSQINEAFVSPVYKVNANVTDIALRLKKSETEAAETKEKLKTLTEEHGLLKKNIARFIRKKEEL